jgi:hypothetical protein
VWRENVELRRRIVEAIREAALNDLRGSEDELQPIAP